MSWYVVKQELNSSVGTPNFKPLDKQIEDAFEVLDARIEDAGYEINGVKEDIYTARNTELSKTVTINSAYNASVQHDMGLGLYAVTIIPSYSANIGEFTKLCHITNHNDVFTGNVEFINNIDGLKSTLNWTFGSISLGIYASGAPGQTARVVIKKIF